MSDLTNIGGPSTSDKKPEKPIELFLQHAGFVTVSEYAQRFKHRWDRISFGCKALDDITNGGVNTSAITELSGESGTGKTQLCLQLAMMAQLPYLYGGINKDCVFICTEKPFPSERAVKIQESLQATFAEYKSHHFLDRILVQYVSNHKKLITSITKKIKPLIDERRIGIIIIDSVAGIFRTICDDFAERSTQMRSIVDKLLEFAKDISCAVVCVNQMSYNEINNELVSVPALGIAWQRLVSSRFLLTKTQTSDTEYERKLKVIFSPYLDNKEANFIITTNGVEDILFLCTMHPGLDDNTLLSFSAYYHKYCHKYYKIQSSIQQMEDARIIMLDEPIRLQFLKKIIISLQHIPIETFDDFVTSLALTCQIHLLRHVSPIVIEINQALLTILDRNLDDLVDDPIKIHLVAENLYRFLDNDLNLIYIVGNISFYNNFSYFVSLSLVWAALHRVVDVQVKMFRLYELNDLSKIIKKIPTDIVKNQTQFYRILSLISAFQNLYILRDHRAYAYGKYSDIFKFEKSDVETILIEWLNKVRSYWESISKVFNPQLRIEHIDGISKVTNDKSLEITELLVVDIIGLFESFEYNKCSI